VSTQLQLNNNNNNNNNKTRLHCVNQTGKKQSKSLAARHGRETAWARHGMCEFALKYIFQPDTRKGEQ
jgi:hypothetical protein